MSKNVFKDYITWRKVFLKIRREAVMTIKTKTMTNVGQQKIIASENL